MENSIYQLRNNTVENSTSRNQDNHSFGQQGYHQKPTSSSRISSRMNNESYRINSPLSR